MNDYGNDPLITFLAEQYSRRKLFFGRLELGNRLQAAGLEKKHLQELIDSGAIECSGPAKQCRLTLPGLLRNAVGKAQKPVFDAVLATLQAEAFPNPGFEGFGWPLIERHSQNFHRVDFPEPQHKVEYVYNALYLLGVVGDCYGGQLERWGFVSARLEEVLEVRGVEELLTAEASRRSRHRASAARKPERHERTEALCELDQLVGVDPRVVAAARRFWSDDTLAKAVEEALRVFGARLREISRSADDLNVAALHNLLTPAAPEAGKPRVHLEHLGMLSKDAPLVAKDEQEALHFAAVSCRFGRNVFIHAEAERRITPLEAIRWLYMVSWVLGELDKSTLVSTEGAI